MHEISQIRMHGTSRKNLTMFKKLCGPDAASNIRLVTTKWSHVKEFIGQERERQLCEIYWNEMMGQGSSVVQFRDTLESAWDIVNSIVAKNPVGSVLIQRELVDLRKTLPETEAGIALRQELEALLEEEKARARDLKKEATPEMQAKYTETVHRIRSTLDQIRQLRIPLGRKITTLFGFNRP
jgi:hypothetical protein